MRRIIAALLLLIPLAACRQQHPINVFVSPRFNDTKASPDQMITKIAVFDCTSSLQHADDPDELAPKTLQRYLEPALAQRTDYKLIATGTVVYAIEKTSTMDAYKKFLRSYAMSDKPDMAFLTPLAQELQCDGFLIPVVDLWQKDEVDFQENSTPATYVGATITIVSAEDGSILFRATDEDYLEGARSETGDRSIVTSESGAVYADLGAKVHRAPPFEEVAVKVAGALAASLPAR